MYVYIIYRYMYKLIYYDKHIQTLYIYTCILVSPHLMFFMMLCNSWNNVAKRIGRAMRAGQREARSCSCGERSAAKRRDAK